MFDEDDDDYIDDDGFPYEEEEEGDWGDEDDYCPVCDNYTDYCECE